MQTQEVLLAEIDISRFNTRKNLAAGGEDPSLEDLARSIAERGLIQPPTLRPTAPSRYEVIAGQRRILACQQLGWDRVTVIIRDDLSDSEAIALSLIENVQRADMSPIDKVRAYQALRGDHGTIQAVAKATGIGKVIIRKYITLLQLAPELQQAVGTGNGPNGTGVMAQLAIMFKDPVSQMEAWEQVKGFNS